MKYWSLITVFCLLSWGCATAPPTPETTEERDRGDQVGADAVRSIPRKRTINYDQLQKVLAMKRPASELGFAEKAFNTCKVGSGYSSEAHCENQFMVVIHFRFQCRDSEGTVEAVTNSELMPLAAEFLKWKVGLMEGSLQTDQQGYAQIRFVAPGSSSNQNLRLVAGTNSLRLQAAEVTRIIAPKYWCRN